MTTQITALPTPPSKADPANFATRGDAFLGALPTFTTQANALAIEVNNDAAAAAVSAANAAASAAQANAVTGVTKWVSGTTYANGAAVYSPIDYFTYRRKTASGSDTTDPSADTTNWTRVVGTGDVAYSSDGNLRTPLNNAGNRVLINVSNQYQGRNSRLVVRYTGAGSENGLTLANFDNTSARTTAINFLYNAAAAGGTDFIIGGSILQQDGNIIHNSVTSTEFEINGIEKMRVNSGGVTIGGGGTSGGYILETRIGNYAANLSQNGVSIAAYNGTDPTTVQGWRAGMFMRSNAGGVVSFVIGAPNSDSIGVFGVADWIVADGLGTNRITRVMSGNASEAITILANANIGIGNATPTDRLHVAGAIRATGQSPGVSLGTEGALLDFTTTNIVRIGHTNGAAGTARPVTFVRGTAVESGRFSATGEFGIGTSTPENFFGSARQLAVSKDQAAVTTAMVGNNTTGAAVGAAWALATGTTNSNVFFTLNDNSASPQLNINLGTAVTNFNVNLGGTTRLSTTATATTLTGNLVVSGNATIGGIDVGYRSLPVVTTTGTTAALADRGKAYFSTGTMTIPGNVFAAGDSFVIYNNSGATINIALGAGLTTLRIAGTATTGARTLLQRGIATVMFVSATEAVISGAGVA